MCHCTTKVYDCSHKYLVIHYCRINNPYICEGRDLHMIRERIYTECKVCVEETDRRAGVTRGMSLEEGFEEEERARVALSGEGDRIRIPIVRENREEEGRGVGGGNGDREVDDIEERVLEALTRASADMDLDDDDKNMQEMIEEVNEVSGEYEAEEGEIREMVGERDNRC